MSVDSSGVPARISTAAKVCPAVRRGSLPRPGVMYDIMEEEVYEFQAAELPDEPRFCPQAQFNDKPDSLFFNDGVRKIDFVMVYEDEDRKDFDKRHTYQRHKVAFVHAAFVTFVSMAAQMFSTLCRLQQVGFFFFLTSSFRLFHLGVFVCSRITSDALDGGGTHAPHACRSF